MANGADDEDVIHLASFRRHRGEDGKTRTDSFITISDDSDDELLMFAANHPVQIKSEAEEGDEDEDEDVVILEPQTPLRPTVIRPAAPWDRGGFQRPVDSRDRVPTEAAAHPSGWRTYPEAGGSAPSAFEDDHNAAPSVARAHTPAGDQRTPLQEDSYPADHRAHLEKEVLVATAPEPVGPVDAGHEIVVGTQHSADGGVDAAAAPSQEQPLQQSAPPPPPPLLPLTPDAVEAVVEQRAPQEPPPAQPLEVAVRIDNERPGPSAANDENGLGFDPHLLKTLVKGVMDLFPDVDEAFIGDLIRRHDLKDLNLICNFLLENPEYPKNKKSTGVNAHSSILLEANNNETQEKENYFDFSKLGTVDHRVALQAADLLMGDFKMLSSLDIKWALNSLKGHYAITRKALSDALKKWREHSTETSGKRKRRKEMNHFSYIDFKFEHGSTKMEKRMFFLENKRRYWRSYDMKALHPSLQNEIKFYEQKAKEMAEHEDFLLALQMNEEQYQKDGQLIECCCCYGEFAFEDLTQCTDGHLFCKECLVKYAQEAVFGSGRSELSCMDGNCSCSFPTSELEKVLPDSILCKYYERQAEEAVAATCADELVRCPFCNFPALLDKEISLFSCPNPRCRKETCRKCHVLWKDHVDKTCEQVLERDEIRLRVTFEEKMTAARVRKCHKCGTGLVKSEGCNRMSCRCGAFMCYLCREPINGYNHFCQHARSPGAECRHCKKCSLWTDPTQDDERIIQEIQKQAEAELQKKNSENKRKRVGPPPEPLPAKVSHVAPRGVPLQMEPAVAPHGLRAPLLVAPQMMLPHLPHQPLHVRPIPAPYVPPLPNIPINFELPNINLEFNMPMHYGPHHRFFRPL
ncbi:E3 ubiquitin-protein ligase RNF216 [Scleropages formosus]|uniref:Ring finger protein 216 n=2 Tax=Scleropages formosus TaxID=113540 RepID=A0A8C9R4F3_SCLFO|nr:E3 ubiquitin-protein ligase RNF216 [Scleropages formosus]XP_018594027.1 E3 ubiquitin-protein ligase RNF216 [Scleropages formosus]